MSTQDWEQHLQQDHQRWFFKPNLQVVLSTALVTERKAAEREECPLCQVVLGKPQRAFAKHVGQHMEQIALMALPRDTEDDSSGGSTATNQETENSKDANNFEEDSKYSVHQSAGDGNRSGDGSQNLRVVPAPPEHDHPQTRPFVQKMTRSVIAHSSASSDEVVCPFTKHDGSDCRKTCIGVRLIPDTALRHRSAAFA